MSARWSAGLVAVCVALAGCNKKVAVAPPPPAKGDTPGPNASPDELKASAEAFAKEFLAAAAAGTPVAAKLSADFKKAVAEPIPAVATDAEKKQGYSDAVADGWAKSRAAGKAFAAEPDQTAVTASVAVFRGTAGPGVYTLRLTRDGGPWVADWFAVNPKFAAAIPSGTSAADIDAALARFAGVAFLDAILDKSDDAAEAIVLAKTKADLAGPRFDADKPRGYSRSALHGLFADFRGKATGYKLTKIESGGGTFTLRGELTDPTGNRPLTLALGKGPRPGDWLVQAFDVK